MKYICLSTNYKIRNDVGCSYLISDKIDENIESEDFSAFPIPSFMGYILSEIGRSEFEISTQYIADKIGVNVSSIKCFINQLNDNKATRQFKMSDGDYFNLPKYLLHWSDKPDTRNFITVNGFNPNQEFRPARPTFPLTANLMITTACVTNCIYCYANRNIGPNLDKNELFSVIDELKKGGTINLNFTGGDIFAHKEWKELVEYAIRTGYKPLLSTKKPLKLEDLEFFRKIGYRRFQFSLDSSDSNIISKTIGVSSDYIDLVSEMLENCSSLKIDVQIRSVITAYNEDIENIKNLYEYIRRYDCVKEWDISIAFYTLTNRLIYSKIKPHNKCLSKIYHFVKDNSYDFPIRFNKICESGYFFDRKNTVDEFVNTNAICLANSSGISILSNGLCSVCEMLYDDPEYVIGDLNINSIHEIWNGKKALVLYSPEFESIDKNSPCSKCGSFNKCKTGFDKRICYLDIMKSGKSRHFPDPRCPEAEKYDIVF